MKVLKKVVCVTHPLFSDNEGRLESILTYNKIYDVLLEAPSVLKGTFKYLIKSDDNNTHWFNVKEFKDLDEVRNEKIEKILS